MCSFTLRARVRTPPLNRDPPTKRWSMVMSEATTFTKDPTCGMNVDEATAVHSDRDGRTYYFCSEMCQQKFESVSAGESTTCC